ncbi:unnamed protein product [Pleuronectes platessa]|uniref:Uncharacterized protein n=1 Tax=Pleuronectes platessa TaxID=8262 RepID=A0A9N7UCN9_PLEPL|nr:unnamed protein product [Pleuronectes platessa]
MGKWAACSAFDNPPVSSLCVNRTFICHLEGKRALLLLLLLLLLNRQQQQPAAKKRAADRETRIKRVRNDPPHTEKGDGDALQKDMASVPMRCSGTGEQLMGSWPDIGQDQGSEALWSQ